MSGLEQLDLAEAAFSAKDYAAALEHAGAALVAGLENRAPYALLCRGLLHRSLGNLVQARADIEPWLKLDPNWAKVIAELDQQIAAQKFA